MKAKNSLSILALCLALSLAVACSKGASDAQISGQVQTRIASDGNIQSKQISVQSANGVVTLSGNVATEMERTSAANDAATVSGVKTVINNLQVQPLSAQAIPAAPAPAPTPIEPPRRASGATQRQTPPARTSRQSAASVTDRTTTTPQMANNATPAPAVPLPPARPATVTVPDGTEISVRLIDPLDSERNQAGDTFHATLAQAIMVGDEIVIPSGADVEGRVIEAKNAAHFSGSSSLTVELTRLMVNRKTYNLQTDQWSKQGTARGKNTAVKVGGGAALGAIIGGIAGGGKGAAIGAGVGAGAGTGVQAVTRGQQTQLASETVLNFRLQNSLTVTPTSHRNRE
ncbi:MAG TPA: BON domain-containing protein [Terriglobales bacterium]